MSERHRQIGFLTELREKLKAFELRVEGKLDSMRSSIFVTESVLDLDGPKIRQLGSDIAADIVEGNRIRAQIAKLEDELGQ